MADRSSDCPAVEMGPAAMTLSLAGCRTEMYDQPRYEPLEASHFFETGPRRGRSSSGPFPSPINALLPE